MTRRAGWTKKLLYILGILNIFDAVLTWILVQKGMVIEVNPVMDYFISQGPLSFFLVKIGVMTGVITYVLIRLTDESAYKWFYVILGTVIAYSILVLMLISSPIIHWYIFST